MSDPTTPSDAPSDSAPSGQQRTHTFIWDDPMPLAEAARRMSGLAFWRAIFGGELPPPPIAIALGFRGAEVGEGRIVFALQPAEYHYNPLGVVQGGLPAAVLDAAMGSAVHTTLPAGVGYTTLEIKINFIRAITIETGELRAEGSVIHAGGRTATAQGRLTDAAGKLYAHGTTTCIILRP